jgi:putative transposase
MKDDTEISNLIHELYLKFPYYGYRRIAAHLRHEGVMINRKRVNRLMREMGLKAIYPKPRTSIPDSRNSVHPYLLKGLEIKAPNQVWAVDITYIKLPTGMVYLFALIDWHSRFIVGWKLANSMTSEHGIDVFLMAIKHGKPEICNADQGAQFTSAEWLAMLMAHGVLISHDGIGRCIDNVRIERFWRTVKYEDVHLMHYQTLSEAKVGIGKFIAHYNYYRPHQALGYARPADVYFV